MGNNWINVNEQAPNEGEFVLVFSLFIGVKVGIYHDGCLETRWSHGETEKWENVWYWMPIDEIPLGKK